MRLSRHVFSKIAVLLAAVTLLPAGLAGQQPSSGRDYSKPVSHLPNFFAPFGAQEVPEPVLANAPRIDQLVRDGRLYLSLNDAIALALENNLDLAIARYNLSIADTDVLRAKAGSGIRGVATGIVRGTPGGSGTGVTGGAGGSQPGGTSPAAGGEGAGSSGLVQSTLGAGPAVPSFDPQLTSSLTINHSQFPLANTVTSGVPNLNQNTGTANFTYSQAFATGTSFSLDFNNSRQTTNSLRTTLLPQVNSAVSFNLRQRLLQGWGIASNTRFIRISRNNREISDVAFRNQVMSTVNQIQNIYWDLVNAYEDVKVRERSLSLAERTLSDNQKQVDIGTLAPIEIVRAEAEVASRRQELIVSQTNLQLQQLFMKNAVTRNQSDPVLAAADVVPTDAMALPAQEEVVPTQDLIADAFAGRPELAQARIDLTNRDINKRAARNALLPSVDFIANYGGSGLSGLQNPAVTCASNPCSAQDLAEGRFIEPGGIRSGGYGTALTSVFDNPNYTVGFQLNIPIRNRAAQADQVRSELEFRQAQLRMQQLHNQIAVEVRNAQFAVQQNRARVDAARKARELAEQSLDAEQKKYSLGASTNFQVLQAQRDLSVSESNVVAAMAAYEKSRVELDRVTGNTLVRLGISLDDAESGTVSKMPQVPYVTPRTDIKMERP